MPEYRSVFRDETKLDINYVPHKLPHRDRELRMLKEFFNFLLQFPEKMAQRVLIVGDVGTGKTVLSQRFGVDISQEISKHGTSFRYIHVNCREYRGSLFLIMQHAVQVFHPNFPRRGYSAEELLRIFMQILDDERICIILVLDEFDSLIEREGSEAIYKLTRLQEARQNKPQRLSLICILRSLSAIAKLDASTRSTLQSNIINLEKYSKQQLIDILRDRASIAFKPLAVPEDTTELIAELAFSENGNARFGIELLWRAGKYADAENLDIVTPDCARRAVSSIIPAVRKDDLVALGLHEKLLLLGIANLFKEGQKICVSLAENERAYTIMCEEFNVKPKSHTQLWEYLQDLSATGIVETEVLSSTSRGRSTMIYLPRIPAHELEKELRSILARTEVRRKP
ncbi:ORC1-type DNA replication protein [Candidatus Bathyarchaeota archaeon]|nr:ORC1-type DNA replication protein [Candidatus Bathyarchaeota archaeon]